MFEEIGLAESLFDNDSYELFNNIKNEQFTPIDASDFSELIDIEDFYENEGWYPEDIYNQDPDTVFFKGYINKKELIGIVSSGSTQIFTANGEMITPMDLSSSKATFKEEHDKLSWLLAPANSVLSIINTGTENDIFNEDNIRILKSDKGVRYQIIENGQAVSAMQVVNDVIENAYTSIQKRQQGLSKLLTERALQDFPNLQHSLIQTDLGKLYSRNSKLRHKP